MLKKLHLTALLKIVPISLILWLARPFLASQIENAFKEEFTKRDVYNKENLPV